LDVVNPPGRLLSCAVPLHLLLVSITWAQTAVVSAGVANPVAPGGRTVLPVTFTFERSLHQTKQVEYFYVRLDGAGAPVGGSEGAIRATEVVYPEGTPRDGTIWYDSPVTLGLSIEVAAGAAPGTYVLDLAASYQLCTDEGVCYLPQQAALSAPLEVRAAGLGAAPPLRLLLLAFLGGLILNFMPCVLPVLSIKALGLVRQAGKSRRSALITSSLYTGGILASFLVLAGVVVALKASGQLVGWGFQFQSPGYITALLAVVFVFALSLFDVFSIDLPLGGAAARASAVRGHMGSFTGGVMAVLLATPCTAPFLGTALGYAFSQPSGTILLMFTAVGLGLAFPFALLGLWPGLARRIPKPGPWTGVFRTVMGFLLVGTAVFLFDVLIRQVGGAASVRVLVFLAVLAFAAWIYGRFGPTADRWKRWVALGAAVAMGTAAGLATLRFDPPGAPATASLPGASGSVPWARPPTDGALQPFALEPSPERTAPVVPVSLDVVPEGWEVFRPGVVDRYRADGEPVFLAFGAEWCWTCKVNETLVLERRDVLAAFAARGVHLVYGDYTNADSTISRWLQSYGRAGVPMYVYYAPGQPPRVLPELLTRGMVLDLLAAP
jgi:thiol:disulfide interchange protein DsbD